MNIAIILPNYEKNKAGINRYTYGLLKALGKNDDTKFYCYGNNHLDLENVTEIKTVFDNALELGDLEKQYLNSYYKIDMVISFYPAIDSKYITVPTMLVIYDLSPLEHPEWFANSKGMYDYFDISLRKSAQFVDKIITISEYTKEKIKEFYNVPENKIQVVHPAISEELIMYRDVQNDNEDIRTKFGINGEYVLSICTLQPRKNLISLVKCFNKFKERNESNLKLVLVGQLGWKTDELVDLINNSRFSKDIIQTGYVTDYEMACLYKKCIFFAYVSYYEGFGMPILEAQYFGKAVLASEATSMPEVGGDAACYCDPYSIDSVLEGFEKLVNDSGYRIKLENEACKQASKFSYNNSAKKMLEVIDEIKRDVHYGEISVINDRIYKKKNSLLRNEQWSQLMNYRGIVIVRSARIETLISVLNRLGEIGYTDNIFILGRQGDDNLKNTYNNLKLSFFAIADDEKYGWDNSKELLNNIKFDAVLVLYRYVLTYEHRNLYEIVINSQKKGFCADCEGNLKSFNNLDEYVALEEEYAKNCLNYK